MPEVNIVELIESNPITKLSNTDNVKLLNKIKSSFTNFEQQLFISSFFCYLNYDKNSDFVIDLDNVWKWLGFQQKYHALTLLEKHFVINIDYKYTAPELAGAVLAEEKKVKQNGGQNRKIILLTIKCFKSLCLKAQTKKSGEIHEYYMKMEEVLHEVIEEESSELKKQLENAKIEIEQQTELHKNTIEQQNETHTRELQKKIAKDREQFLLREFGTIGSIVYIIKVKTNEDGSYIIKIGESRKGVQSRYNEHKSKYPDEILLMDCFSVKRSKEFESFLHNHVDIKFNRVTDLPGHETERELFLIGKNVTYRTVSHIINMNIKNFNEYNDTYVDKLQAEVETYRNIFTANNNKNKQPTVGDASQFHTIQETMLKLLSKIEKLEKLNENLEKSNKEILAKLNTNQIKTTTGFNQPLATVGSRLQQIDPETLTLSKVYESIAECIKEHNFKLKRPSIMKAVEENTVYHGYRWLYAERNRDPNIIENIQPTKQTKLQNLGYIAKLNPEQTEILNVYLDRKTACTSNGYATTSVLDNPVKNETIYNGFFYTLYENCDEDLQEAFVEKHGEPILYKNGVGQFDSETNEILQEFICKYECIKQLKISDKTLAKALDKPVAYNTFHFKTLGSKLQVVA